MIGLSALLSVIDRYQFHLKRVASVDDFCRLIEVKCRNRPVLGSDSDEKRCPALVCRAIGRM